MTGVFGWVCVMTGTLLTSWGIFNLRDASASSGWPTADGRVLSSRVERSRGSSDSRDSYRYSPAIRYSYSVDGKQYTGDRVSFRDDHYGRREKAQRIVDEYATGSSVPVRFKPDDPSQAVLEADYDWSTYLPVALPGFILVTGIFLVRIARRQARKESPFTPI